MRADRGRHQGTRAARIQDRDQHFWRARCGKVPQGDHRAQAVAGDATRACGGARGRALVPFRALCRRRERRAAWRPIRPALFRRAGAASDARGARRCRRDCACRRQLARQCLARAPFRRRPELGLSGAAGVERAARGRADPVRRGAHAGADADPRLRRNHGRLGLLPWQLKLLGRNKRSELGQSGFGMLHPGFHKALAYLTSDNVRSLLMDLVDISSPTGNEIGVAQYLVARMRRIGMETDLPLVDAGRPNAAGHLRGHGHGLNLLFTGHMDTSYSGAEEHLAGEGFQPKAIYRDGWVWGLGANNMKSGLAAALSAIEAIAAAGIELPGDISFAGVVG